MPDVSKRIDLETSGTNYPVTRGHFPGERRSHLHRCGSLKTGNIAMVAGIGCSSVCDQVEFALLEVKVQLAVNHVNNSPALRRASTRPLRIIKIIYRVRTGSNTSSLYANKDTYCCEDC